MMEIAQSTPKLTHIDIVTIKQVKERSATYQLPRNGNITEPQHAQHVINQVFDLENQASEQFGIITLDTKNNLNGLHILAIGSLSATLVHPREVFKQAMLNNANSILLFHNHPSGDTTPSPQDVAMTQRLRECGELLGITVLDHIIIGDGKFCSLAELGVI